MEVNILYICPKKRNIMQWEGRRQSNNVEDRRGSDSGKKLIAGGGILGIVILLLQYFGGETGQMIAPVLEQFNQTEQTQTTNTQELTAEQKKIGEFVATVLADTEDVWEKIFSQNGLGSYEKPKLVLFTSTVSSGCGNATSATGPFYCPADHKLYMDMSFFEELRTRFGAKGGDFAIAYVMAHEVGHHIQTLLGTSQKVRQAQQGKSKAYANKLSVAQELQADFYAGVWAHHNKKYLDSDDIDEAISAAHAVAEQRKEWFMKGYETGDIRQGDTFAEIR